jgi:hypothetical protein
MNIKDRLLQALAGRGGSVGVGLGPYLGQLSSHMNHLAATGGPALSAGAMPTRSSSAADWQNTSSVQNANGDWRGGAGQTANELNPMRMNASYERGGARGNRHYRTKEECYAAAWRDESHDQDCKNLPSARDEKEAYNPHPTGRALLEKERRQREREERADLSKTNGRPFPSEAEVANFLLPHKPEKWRSDFAMVLREMLRRSHSHSQYSEDTKNRYQGDLFSGFIFEGKYAFDDSWDKSEYYMHDSYDPSTARNEGGSQFFGGGGVDFKGKPGTPGGATPKKAVAHVSYMSVFHGGGARDVFMKNAGLFQDKANQFQVPEIVGIPHTNEIWVFRPQYGPSGRYYKTENGSDEVPGEQAEPGGLLLE